MVSLPRFQCVHNVLNLFQNIDTWMDVDDMTKKKASIIDRMAEAVDDAFAVIIGVSEKYYQSRNCKYGKYYILNRSPITIRRWGVGECWVLAQWLERRNHD